MNPMNSEGSGFRFYSFGIVVEDKTDDGDYIKVTPIEELPLVKGKLSEAAFNYDVSGTDHKGVNVTSNIKGVSYVIAQWAPLECNNRNTAPNVYESETVMLLKYGSTDDVFWCDLFREPKLRRLENVIHSYSNLEEKGTAYDQDSSYWTQISTRDQVIKLHTSNNRDEKVGYDITIDTANGTFELLDTNTNRMFLDSVNGDFKLFTTNSIELDSQMIRINGQTYVRTTGPEITETGDHITNNGNQSIQYTSSGTWDADSAATINLHKTTDVDGELIATGDVTGAGTSLNTHTHKYNPGSGGPTETQPTTPGS